MMGKVRGRVGELVFYQVGDQMRIRGHNDDIKDCKSPAQLKHRNKVRGIADLFGGIDLQIYHYWKQLTVGTLLSGYNLFFKENIKTIDGETGLPDYKALKVCKGVLPLPGEVKAEIGEGRKVRMEWTFNRTDYGIADDCLQIARIMPDYTGMQTIEVLFSTDVTRSAGSYEFVLPDELQGEVHVYGFFKSSYTNDISDSFYVGKVADDDAKDRQAEDGTADRLFLFNPDCELAIANGGKNFTPSANVVQMADDLAFLPAYLGEEGDCVLVKEMPDEQFNESVGGALGVACKAVTEEEVQTMDNVEAVPWGKSPKMCHWLAKRGLGEEWRPEQKDWYSRKTAREGLAWLVEEMSLPQRDIIPRICNTPEEIEQEVSDGKYIVKAPWSSSGKGLLALEQTVSAKEKEWLSGVLRRQGYLMVEKRLDKTADFAMEFRKDGEKVEFIGWSVFATGEHGEYCGNYIGPQEGIERGLVQRAGAEVIEQLKEKLPEMLQRVLPGYTGYLGVDMMLYRDESGQECVQPCVEINLRYNMGIVALMLGRKYVCPEAKGEFAIRFYSGEGEALSEQRRLQQKYPPVYENNRIKSGYLNLTPVNETTRFVASLRCY